MVFPEALLVNLELAAVRVTLGQFTLEADAVLRGRVTAVFGPSGAGKTTLVEIVAGLRRPAAGRVALGGGTLTDVGARIFVPPERRHLGYVPQEGALFPHLSVRQNLLYGRRTAQAAPAGLDFAHVTEILEIVPLVDRRVTDLSGGEKRRVALGRALLTAPRLLLLDEPLAGLDLPLRERLLPYLARIRDELAIPMIYVTHSADEVMALCDEVLLVRGGRVRHHPRPADVFVPDTSRHFTTLEGEC